MKSQKPTKKEGFIYYRKNRKKWEARYFIYDAKTGMNKTKTKLCSTQE